VIAPKGWVRDQDEKSTCHEGYRKKQRMRQENREDLEARAGFNRVDHFSSNRL
jgi:hypothetical protein